MTRSARVRAALGVLALTCATARAQPVTTTGPVTVCRLPADGPALLPGAARGAGRGGVEVCIAPTARFEVTYTGFPPDAEAAFQAAVDTWACRLTSHVPVRVDARWEALATSTLGSAGPYLTRDFREAPLAGTWYPAALADAFAGRDLEPGQPDIEARFNSAFGAWHLDASVPPPPGTFDLATVVLHELGHGLGFIGGLTVEGGQGFVGEPSGARGPYVYDRFTEDRDGTPLLDATVYPDGSAELAAVLQDAVRFDAPAVRQASGGPLPLYAPPRWDDGASYSHLDEQSFAAGTPDGLMTPFLSRGEAIAAPGAATCAVFADLGWTLSGTCADAVGPTEAPTGAVTLAAAGPNPFRRASRVAVRVAVGQRVRVVLLDALGRAVRLLDERVVEAGEPLVVAVDGRGLAAGVYRVAALGASGEAVLTLVRVR